MRAGIVLGLSYRETEHYGEAVELGERVLADCQRILNPHHPFTLRARANLTDFYRAAARNADRVKQRAQPDTGPLD
jgi:hypothetical protein